MHGVAEALVAPARAEGWRCAGADASIVPHVIVVAGGADVAATLAAVRGSAGPRAVVPVIVVGGEAEDGLPEGADDRLPERYTADEARELLARWRPEPSTALDRIEATLGAAAVADLLLRLRHQLEAAMTRQSGGADRQMAHRLGGIAGLLGFSALGEAWLEAEQGRPDALKNARRETRRALAAIARRIG